MNETFIIANRTDTGKARQVNEDSMVTFDSPNGRVVAVCDGMGGQAAGDVASRLACDIITDILENNTFATPNEAITRAVMAANQGILHRAAQSPELEGMGATCVIAIIKNGEISYGWVGDSRIYLVSGHKITRISRDQSYVQSLVDSGQITAAEAENHPRKNEIINALGLDTMTPPELGALPLKPGGGDILMLCSDGLSGMVSEDRMEQILETPGQTLQQKADALVAQANANGGLDNITVQLVEFNGTAAAKAAAAKVAGRSKMLNYIIAAVAVIIVGAALFLFLKPGDKKVKEPDDKVVDTRTPQTSPSTTRQTSAPAATHETKTTTTKTTVVVNDKKGKSDKQTKQLPQNPKGKKTKKDDAGDNAQKLLQGTKPKANQNDNGGKGNISDEDLNKK